jgi:hypothetical protein
VRSSVAASVRESRRLACGGQRSGGRFAQAGEVYRWVLIVVEIYISILGSAGIWAELFGSARARPENKRPKHGPARNNMGRPGPESGPRPGLKFRPVGLPARPA